MGTWPEARSGKAERDRREARYLTPDLLGPVCAAGCGTRITAASAEAGETSHACCASEEFGLAGIPLDRRAS